MPKIPLAPTFKKKKKTNGKMRYLNPGAPLGLYHAPQAYYGYTKALPFLGTVKSNVQTLVVGK